MDPSCLEYRLSAQERQAFDEQGYLVVPGVLSPAELQHYRERIDGVHQGALSAGLAPEAPFVLRNFIGEDAAFAPLAYHPRVLPKVWGILGFNIYLYHAHLGVTPPLGNSVHSEQKSFHQDSGRVNQELEGNPRPRLSLKVAYYLDGDPEPGNGNLYVVPGSHRHDERPGDPDANGDLPGAIAIGVPPGTAVFFDRRLWHSKSPNLGSGTRKVLFCGYAYRWLRTKDEMTVRHLYPSLDPIQRQLLGDGLDANGYYTPAEADVPLRTWLAEHDPAALTR